MIQSGCGLIAYQAINYDVLPVLKARGFSTFRFISHDQTCTYNAGGSTIVFTPWMRVARDICLRYDQTCLCTLSPLSAPTDIRDHNSGIPLDWDKMQDYLYQYFDYFLSQLDTLVIEILNEPEVSSSYWIKDYTTGVRTLDNIKELWDRAVAARADYLAAHPGKTILLGGPCFTDAFYASEFQQLVTYMAPEADFISAHFYGENVIGGTGYQSWMNTAIAASNGVSLPLWVTECGPYWAVGVYDPQSSHQTDAENWYTAYLAYCDTIGVAKSFMHLGYQLESAAGRIWHLIEADLHAITNQTSVPLPNAAQRETMASMLYVVKPVSQPSERQPRLLGAYFDAPTLNSTARHWIAIVGSGADSVIITSDYSDPDIADAIAATPNTPATGTVDLGLFGVDVPYRIYAANTVSGIISAQYTEAILRCYADNSPNIIYSYIFDPTVDTKTAAVGVVAGKDLTGVWVGRGTPPAWGDAAIHVANTSNGNAAFVTYVHSSYETVSDLVVAGYDSTHAYDTTYPLRSVTFDQVEFLLSGSASFDENLSSQMTLQRRLKIAKTAYLTGTAEATIGFTGTATLGTHFSTDQVVGGVAQILNGSSSTVISVDGIHVTDDYVNRTIIATLTAVPANESIGSQAVANFTIVNIDTPPTPTVSWQGDITATEGTTATAYLIGINLPADVTVHIPASNYTTAEDRAVTVSTSPQAVNIVLKNTAGNQGGAVVPVTISGTPVANKISMDLTCVDNDPGSNPWDGVPTMDFATEAGPFIYKDTVSGVWSVRVGGAGTPFATRTHMTGTVTTTSPFSSFTLASIESADTCTSDGTTITFDLFTQGSSYDGFDFTVDEANTTLTFTFTLNPSGNAYLGVGKAVQDVSTPWTPIDNGTPSPFTTTVDSATNTVAITWAEAVTAPKPGRGITFQKPLNDLVAP